MKYIIFNTKGQEVKGNIKILAEIVGFDIIDIDQWGWCYFELYVKKIIIPEDTTKNIIQGRYLTDFSKTREEEKEYLEKELNIFEVEDEDLARLKYYCED